MGNKICISSGRKMRMRMEASALITQEVDPEVYFGDGVWDIVAHPKKFGMALRRELQEDRRRRLEGCIE